MGANNIKGIWWMETIYPPENGMSVIPPEKLQKEIQKGNIKLPDPNAEREVDFDMDEKLDHVINEVWAYYDKKNEGIIKKSVIQQFFKDALELYALRVGKKSGKECVVPGVNFSQALEASVAKLSQTGQATKKEFTDFLNCYSIDEALGSFLGITQVSVDSSVKFVDTSQFKEQASKPKEIKYRDYSVLDQ